MHQAPTRRSQLEFASLAAASSIWSLCQLCSRRALPCFPAMEHKTEAEPRKESTSTGCDSMHTMQIRMLKTDVSPMKKKLAEACSHVDKIGFNVWLHIYDLGPFSK